MPQSTGQPSSRSKIPGYQLVRKLGEGSMGATYLARQAAMDRQVVIKVLRRELSRDPEYTVRFQREARLAGRLEHENIVQVITVGEAAGYHYMVMEYVEGKDLWDLLPDSGAMDETESLRIALQVARALDCAESRGIIHRDIKPENILVTTDGVAKLCDFGLAKRIKGEARLTQIGSVVGTAHYISPEQARGVPDLDIRSDIYSLGATLYHMVTGETPFSGDNPAIVMTRHLTEQIPWPQDINSAVSTPTCRVIEKMMAKDRRSRHQTPAELIADIELVLAGKTPPGMLLDGGKSSVASTGTVPVPPVRSRPRRRRRASRPPPKRKVGGTDLFRPAGETRSLVAIVAGLPRPLLALLGGVGLLALVLVFWGIFAALFEADGTGDGRDPPEVAAAAEQAWKAIEQLARQKTSEERARELLFQLRQFEKDYGSTRTAAGRQEEIEHYRALARVAVTGTVGERDIEAMFNWARGHLRNHPHDYAGASKRLCTVLETAEGKPGWSRKIRDAIAAVEAARTKAAESEYAARRARAEKCVEQGDIDAALAVLADPPEELRDLLNERLKTRSAKVLQAAEKRFRSAYEVARRHSTEGWPTKGLAELDSLKSFKFSLWKGRIAALRERLEQEKIQPELLKERRRRTAARRMVAQALRETDARFLRGDHAGAMQILVRKRSATPPEIMKYAPEVGFGDIEAIARRLQSYRTEREQALKNLVGRAVRFKRGGKIIDVRIEAVIAGGFRVASGYTTLGYAPARRFEVSFEELGEAEIERLMPAFEPRTPEDHLAAMLWALYRKDRKAAARALAAAGKHRFCEHYRQLLAGSRD
jgi:serine/threonine-protein kinase